MNVKIERINVTRMNCGCVHHFTTEGEHVSTAYCSFKCGEVAYQAILSGKPAAIFVNKSVPIVVPDVHVTSK
ncbi:MAG TPA: hypothetical protein V6C76_11655 [Drouetiella sp.]